ncbi:MAG: hypothetical protein GY820_26715, partial [Gammaproteobacteria bacterium]|nr:hypothetical protein [Gammaproteobacteria bacterium]
SGMLQVNGGSSPQGAAGGAGRIAVYYNNASAFNFDNLQAHGGTFKNDAAKYHGGAGTIYLKDNAQNYGDLIVDNNNIISLDDDTCLMSVGAGVNTLLEANSMENTSAAWQKGSLVGIKLNPLATGSTVFTIVSNTNKKIFTLSGDGDMTQIGTTGAAYIGEHFFRNLTIKGNANVSTLDRVQVAGTLTVETGAVFKAENHQ